MVYNANMKETQSSEMSASTPTFCMCTIFLFWCNLFDWIERYDRNENASHNEFFQYKSPFDFISPFQLDE